MATYTSNYAWTKPEGSDPVDIGVLNNNLDSQDSIVHNAYMQLAPVFSSASTYAVDDVVLYSDNLYKCHTAVTVAGDWDATKWTQVKVTDIAGGGGGGGGHTIENASGTAMTQRDALQFKGGLSVSDDSTNNRTVVSDEYELITWADWQTIVANHEENLHPDAIITGVPGADGDVSVDLMTKLWENPNPTSDMTSGTNITLSSSDYDQLLVMYKTKNDDTMVNSAIVRKGDGISLATDKEGKSISRTVLNNSATSYTAYNGYYNGAVNTSYAIPIAIYGIKTTASVRISAIAENVSTSADKCMLSDGVTSVEDNCVQRTKSGTTLSTLVTAVNAINAVNMSKIDKIIINNAYIVTPQQSGVCAFLSAGTTSMDIFMLNTNSGTFKRFEYRWNGTSVTASDVSITAWTIYYHGTEVS